MQLYTERRYKTGYRVTEEWPSYLRIARYVMQDQVKRRVLEAYQEAESFTFITLPIWFKSLALCILQGCEESPSLQAAALRAIVNLSKGNSSIKDEIGKLRIAKAVENPSESKKGAFIKGKRAGS